MDSKQRPFPCIVQGCGLACFSLFPPSRGGVQHFGGRVDQRVADGGGDVAAALAAHGGDGGDAVGFAGGEENLFAFHHVHKTDRHPDDECRPQPGLDLFGDGQKGCGGIANGQDGTRMLLRGPVHGGHSASGPGGLGGGGDLRVGHVAERRAAHFGKAGRVMPASAMLVSVTMGVPARRAATPAATAPCVKRRFRA